MLRHIKVSEICKNLNLKYQGEDVTINGLNLCNRNSLSDRIIAYAVSDSYADLVKTNLCIACMVLPKDLMSAYSGQNIGKTITYILSETPEKSFYDIHEYLYRDTDFYEKYDFQPIMGKQCDIDEDAVIKNGVVIGDNVAIGAGTVILPGTEIGDNTVIGCNCTIGSEGFQVIRTDGRNRKIKHAGGVYIGKDVWIGDNVAVANSIFETSTFIGDRVLIDNLCHIGHNSVIKSGAVITAGTTLCGSSYVDEMAWIGAGSVQLNRTTVGKNAMVGIGSVVVKTIPDDSLAYGVPARVRRGGVKQKTKILYQPFSPNLKEAAA